MLKTLYSKLALVLLVLFSLVGILFITVSVYTTEMYQQEVNQKLNRSLAELIVAEKIIMRDSRVDEDALKEIFHMLMVINPSIEVYLLDEEGTILAYSAEPGKVKRKSVDLGPIRSLLEGGATLPLLGDNPRDPQGKKVFSAAPVSEGGRLEGYLYVILGGEAYDSVIQKLQGSYIFRLSTWVVITSLIVALVTGLLIFAYLTRRLKRLSAAMDGYRSEETGERDSPAQIARKRTADEIDRLGITFQQMARRIETQVEKLKKSDAVRRELVANVSHDLRTPLATLRGYMETLLLKDRGIPEDERRNYLKIAIKHCERLGTLVTNLFELAKLEAEETDLHREPFSLGELIQDVVQKFQISAKAKQIQMITNIGKELPFVNADIALVERVLENLIENALRFTPERGSLSIVLTPDQRDITVQVSDTGCGIPEEELPLIFNRFYKLDRSRRGKPGYSGLGLAITKRILELHNRSIQVESVLNSGTTFTFKLPIHNPA